MTAEAWLPVPGFEGWYEVSSAGRVRSLHTSALRVLSQTQDRSGHMRVTLYRDGKAHPGKLVHQMVAGAFLGPRPDGFVCRHLNGNPTDNRPENLAWGTYSQNELDSVQHGTHGMASRTHCKNGHEFTSDNTRWTPDGWRRCRACARVAWAEHDRRRRAAS